MNPIDMPGSNCNLTAPRDWDETRDGECVTLRVLKTTDEAGHPLLQSAWRPSDIELTQLVNGHAIMLTIYGQSHPPVWIGVTKEPVA